jgi:peroxiredoxin Q/BCP
MTLRTHELRPNAWRLANVLALLWTTSACSKPQAPAPQPQSQLQPSSQPEPQANAPATPLSVGMIAPDFETSAGGATRVRLSAQRGHYALVYFYPKDETPGCTKEACAFRDAFAKFEQAHITIFGVSRDTETSQAAFREHHQLPFALAADPSGSVQHAYGVPELRSGIAKRVSFLVGPDGKIARVFPEVNPALHADEVLAAVPSARATRFSSR